MIGHRVPFTSIAFATVLGVAGGVYIYKPFFESQMKNQGPEKHKQEVPNTLNQPEAISIPENHSPDKVPESPSSAITTGTVSESLAQPVSKE